MPPKLTRRLIAEDLLDALEHRRFYRTSQAVEGTEPLDYLSDCRWWYKDFGARRFGFHVRAADYHDELQAVAAQRALLLRYGGSAGGPRQAPSVKSRQTQRRPRFPGTEIALTQLFKTSAVARRAWREKLPGTNKLIREIQTSCSGECLVLPSPWTRAKRWGTMGTAVDYAVGAVWAQSDLATLFERLNEVKRVRIHLSTIIRPLRHLLNSELHAVRGGHRDEAQLDFFRGLLLGAELDAIYRSSGRASDPPWIAAQLGREVRVAELRERLRANYPHSAVDELNKLLFAATEALPRSKRRSYNPVVGGAPGLEHVMADGDLVSDDTLLELKTSKKPEYEPEHLWQLLGYSALAHLWGTTRIGRIGFCNPRFRHLWTSDVSDVLRRLGGCSMEQLCEWWVNNGAAHGR